MPEPANPEESIPSQNVEKLPSDRRFQLGGVLFLASLLVFFVAGLILYAIYTYSRQDVASETTLPRGFVASTGTLIIISVLVHVASRVIRRERRVMAATCLNVAAVLAIAFMLVQYSAMQSMLGGDDWEDTISIGPGGMVIVLAILHAIHVLGGVIALLVVAVNALIGRYDHERHWPINFTAQYWHFLDLVWLTMLVMFWLTTGGFE